MTCYVAAGEEIKEMGSCSCINYRVTLKCHLNICSLNKFRYD